MKKELLSCINNSIKIREENHRIYCQKEAETQVIISKQREELIKYICDYFDDLPEEIEIKLKENKMIEEPEYMMGTIEWVETHTNFISMNYSKILLAPNYNIRLWEINLNEWDSLHVISNIHLIIIKEMIPWFEEQIAKEYGCSKQDDAD
jgi:septum formation topological specificity factor MinE